MSIISNFFITSHAMAGSCLPVRKMPYGIQQPAVSAQVAQLEEYLGVTLFQRLPFPF